MKRRRIKVKLDGFVAANPNGVIDQVRIDYAGIPRIEPEVEDLTTDARGWCRVFYGDDPDDLIGGLIPHKVTYARGIVARAIERGQAKYRYYRIVPEASKLTDADRERLKRLNEKKQEEREND